MCSAGIILYKYYTEERQKKEIRGAFQTYLSPAVVEQVIEDPSKLALGGEKRELTVLFSDVRGFTTISEALDAEELANLLNEYLTPMTDLVFKHGGTLDKYMGDAVMAFWGAPIPQEDHAFRACDCALEMMRVLHELQRDFEARGYPPIDIGIGINTGPMSVGNMGSTQRMDYTVMGDAVNLGSRLEGINKTYGTHIIVSEFTWRACEGQIWGRELDLVAVKGKKEPVRIYELIDYKPVPTMVPLVNRFHEALQVYRDGDFARAFQMFQDILRDYPSDGPSKTFLERSRDLLENPPESWNGVYVAKTK
ncbi:MAG: adenylate/guanylate cyclase domain-containing protein [Candidatus Dadabacteria bacterium]|nr:MAG: adenylate/guanylate cyclase domain-containing protein [Candidatus Dadabacteria bacterium]